MTRIILPPHDRRRVAQNASLMALSLLIALLLSELFLRLVWVPWSLRSDPAFEVHPVYGFAPIPGISGVHETPEYKQIFHHTSQGLRGFQVFDRGTANQPRILFLGDSFTYGLGADDEETFVGLFQKNYPQLEIANTGCNGYGTQNEIAVLRHFGAAFHPQLTLLFFFWNDLSDNLRPDKPLFQLDPSGQVLANGSAPESFDPMALRPGIPRRRESPWRVLYFQELLEEGLKSLRYRYFGKKANFVTTQPQWEEAWRVTGELLRIVQKSAEEIGSRLIIVCLPDHNQVNPQAVIKNITPLQFDIQSRLGDLCRQLGIQYLDLLPAMRDQWVISKQDYYYFRDRHLTPAGNQAVYELIQKPILAGIL